MFIKKVSNPLKYNEIPYNIFYTTYKKRVPLYYKEILYNISYTTYKKGVRIHLYYKKIP